MVKGLFTSLEEIVFQNAYVRGQVEKYREPNAGRNPAKIKHLGTHKKRGIPKGVIERYR